ncbi:4-hydroxy-2-oxo-heptane-1,7-dioate aldolase [Pigmentiphaga humi]|uniref:4-hydroxy-2-oxo-heptane-1,7-dioate aldolase n=1 Tax=Pigmentiphaga humi TaxID=2478468 RepID=A0A3P4B9M6_9BURK|nr:aldolase/citrate lyase family protein [Pigmentiphaga humi]VCU72438.1 4-hydroxy-2-oxo-heptane-1,7-dioate aldolase [Pigmentiphaga humi]
MIDPMLIVNHFQRKLEADERVLLMSLRQLRGPDAAMIVHACGFDGFYADCEHGMFTWEQASALCASALMAGLLPALRVRQNTPADIGAALDAGAQCVIVPHVSSAAEAEAAVRAAKYPPWGERSLAALGPATRYRSLPAGEIVRLMNDQSMMVAMLETADGVAAADEIAAVRGVDALMIGPIDLSAEMGAPGQLDHPAIRSAYLAACEAARKHGKQFVASGEIAAELAQHGARIFLGGTDVGYLISAARKAADVLRG